MQYDICHAKTVTFWNKLITRKLIKLGMDKSGFRGFFSFFFFQPHSYQFVQIFPFLAKVGVSWCKHLKISIMLFF